MPLHRRMTWANAPVVTLVLVLLNCFVYFFLQSSDDQTLRRAMDYYQQSQLGRIEFPAYAHWLSEHADDDEGFQRQKLMQAARAKTKIALIQSDAKFLDALHADEIITATNADYADWHTKRAEFERIRDSAFTPRHALRFSHIEPARMTWAMFMHGGLEHLVGNMIFLLVLGLLVEGALGPWWYLGVYLVGGYGAAFTTVAWHWGDHGLALGASGAIAALMGAYCVIWGLRRVRVFYWFFIVFDYVRVPALVLLPFWFGWQIVNLWLNGGAHVGFDAHAGGILSGAGLALLLRHYGGVDNDFVEADERADQHEASASSFAQAQEHIGKLEIAQARRLLEQIDSEQPGQLRVVAALYRCARYGGSPAQLDTATTRLLEFPAKTAAEIRELKTNFDDYLKSCGGTPRLAPAVVLRLINLWPRIGADADAQALLHSIGNAHPNLPALAAAWFAFSLRAADGSTQRRERLEYLAQHFASSEFATKARFLLQQIEASEG